jgi:peptide chain release factor 3
VDPEDPTNEEYADFLRVKSRFMARDKDGKQVFLADSAFSISMAQEKYPSVRLHFTSEF